MNPLCKTSKVVKHMENVQSLRNEMVWRYVLRCVFLLSNSRSEFDNLHTFHLGASSFLFFTPKVYNL